MKRILFPISGVLLVSLSAMAASQDEEKKSGSSSSRIIQRALANNLEVKLAEAKVHQAQVELQQVRMKIAQEVMQTIAELKDGEIRLHQAQESMAQTRRLADQAMIPTTELRSAEMAVIRQESELQRLKMNLEMIQGSLAETAEIIPKADSPIVPQSRHRTLDRLDQDSVSVDFREESVISAIESVLVGTEIKLVYGSGRGNSLSEAKVDLELEGSRLDILTALMDVLQGNYVFVVRDYGLLLTTRSDAEKYRSPRFPQ